MTQRRRGTATGKANASEREEARRSWNEAMERGWPTVTPSPSQLDQAEPEIERAYERERARYYGRQRLQDELATTGLVWPDSRPNLGVELAIEEPPLSYTIVQLHPEGTNTLFAGRYKSGKSTLVINAMHSLVDGVPFLGSYHVEAPVGHVGYWNGELTARMGRNWLREKNFQKPERAVVLHTRGYRLALEVPAVADRAVRWLGENEVEFWILDPFGRFYAGEENSNTELRRWCESVDEIKRRAGVKDLLVVAHMGAQRFAEGEERSRGGTVLNDWADVRWVYHKEPTGERFFEAEGRDVLLPPQKLGYRHSDRSLSLSGMTRADEQTQRAMQYVCEYVKDHPDALTGDIQKGSRGNKENRLPALKDAKLYGYISAREGRGNAVHHNLTTDGADFLALRTAEGRWREDDV